MTPVFGGATRREREVGKRKLTFEIRGMRRSRAKPAAKRKGAIGVCLHNGVSMSSIVEFMPCMIVAAR
jgi:hypothetical protein